MWRDRDLYMSLYVRCPPSARAIGDKSVYHMASKAAAGGIREFNPEAKIIAMIRNPIDVMVSLHAQSVYNGTENILGFEEAIDAEDSRLHGENLPRRARFLEAHLYRQVVSFSEQLSRFYDTFDHDRIHVIVYDDFASDTAASYNAVLHFLELSSHTLPEFPVVNYRKIVRSHAANAALRYIETRPPIIAPLARSVLPPRTRMFIRDLVTKVRYRFLAKDGKRSSLSPETKVRLQEDLTGEVHSLGAMVERDLSHWLSE